MRGLSDTSLIRSSPRALPSLVSSPSGCLAARYAIDSAPDAFLNSSETQNCRARMESEAVVLECFAVDDLPLAASSSEWRSPTRAYRRRLARWAASRAHGRAH